jgi:hypothetical protein
MKTLPMIRLVIVPTLNLTELPPTLNMLDWLTSIYQVRIADSGDVNGLFRRDVNKIGAQRRWYLHDA